MTEVTSKIYIYYQGSKVTFDKGSGGAKQRSSKGPAQPLSHKCREYSAGRNLRGRATEPRRAVQL